MSPNVYSVGQVNHYIKNMFQEDFLLRQILVKGEVSNCKYHTSGHVYFTLKDSEGALSAILFSGNKKEGLKFPMKNGDQVIVAGSVSVYEKGGTYQIYARKISLDGAGDLYVRFEQLKKELEEMGMFDASYKQPIPKYAGRVGVITAPTGAAVRDIIQISHRRNPYVELILCPALVQGEGAAESIVRGIAKLDAMDLDVLIVGRGGGSIEDLWAFNEEAVARAIFSCKTPVISAVGHETDTCISDYVADLRAPTPSAAAELAVFSYREFQDELAQYRSAFAQKWETKITWLYQRLLTYEKELRLSSPEYRLQQKQQYLMQLEQLFSHKMEGILQEKRHQLALFAQRFDGDSPAKKLSGGFGFAEDEAGKHIYSVSQVAPGDTMTLHLQDGSVFSRVERIDKEEK